MIYTIEIWICLKADDVLRISKLRAVSDLLALYTQTNVDGWRGGIMSAAHFLL
jgi:hypothetical protein